MRSHLFISLLTLSMLVAAFSSGLSLSDTLPWSTQTIDKNGAGGSPSIALDSINNPHIAYCDYESGNSRNPLYIMYASWNGSNWNIENVTQGRGTIDLALDRNDNPHIVFNDNRDRLTYANLDSTGWNIQTVSYNGRSGSLALDSKGNPHIVYLDGDLTMLKYATWTTEGWNTQTVETIERHAGFYIGFSVFLTLDPDDNPRILYGYDISNNGYNGSTTVKYAEWNNASNWVTQTVVSNICEGGFGNLALDSKGYPHFTYAISDPQYTSLNTTFTYVSWNGSAWNTQTFASKINYNGPAKLALDSQDFPHLDYYNQGTDGDLGVLMYATWTGKVWDTQTIDSNSSLAAGPIMLDSNGNPHVTYNGQSSIPFNHITYLKYATTTEPTQTVTPTQTLVPMPAAEVLVVVSVFIVAVLTILAYLWKKKTKK